MTTHVIDKNNPWPWLDPFTENAEDFFHGRHDDSLAIERCVLSGTATVLFGKSGLGKTSLLQAGLFPRLRKAGMLPVLVRLKHGNDVPPPAAQIRERLIEEASIHRLTLPGDTALAPRLAAPAERLWLDLHTAPAGLRDADGCSWQSVFVLDQFEEIFTLGGNNETRQQQDFGILGDLIENRIPEAVEAAINADEDLLDHLQLDAQPYRVVLSLREDYLPELERWCDLIPRLGPNRYRLLPMTEAQAHEAIQLTGGELVTGADTERIVHFIASQHEGPAGSGNATHGAQIEPALLSLLCAGLNKERQRNATPRLNTANLDLRGGRIIEKFYDDAVAKVAPAVTAFLEDELITPDGVRLTYPLKSVLARPGIAKADIDTLINRRLLRKEAFGDGDRIEVVHDRLAAIALRRRQNRQAATKTARDERERKRLRTVAIGLSVLLGCTGVATWWALEERSRAKHLEQEVRHFSKQATVRRLASEGAAMASAIQDGGTLRGYLQMLAAYRLASESFPDQAGAALGGLQAEYARSIRLKRLVEQDAEVASVAFSPDGQRVAVGTRSKKLTVWSAADGAPIGSPFTGHSATVKAVAFTPDGTRIVSGGYDNKVRIWNAATGAPLGAPLEGHTDKVTAIAISPDGKRIASASLDKTLLLWDIASGKAVGAPLAGHAIVSSLAFSPDGRLLASGSWDKTVILWDAASGQRAGAALKGHTGPITSIAFCPDGLELASGGEDNTVRRWDTRTRNPIGKPLLGHTRRINVVAYTPDCSRIASGADDNTIRLWNISTGVIEDELYEGHTAPVTTLAFSSVGQRLASGSVDKTMRIWDISERIAGGKPLTGHLNTIDGLAVSPHLIATGALDATVRLWDATTGTPVGNYKQAWPVSALAVSRDAQHIATGSYDGSIQILNVAPLALALPPLTGHTDWVTSVAFNLDGARIASAGKDGTVRLWNAQTGSAVGKPLQVEGQVSGVVFSTDGTRLFSGGHDTLLHQWDIATGQPVGKTGSGHKGPINGIAVSPDGKLVATASQDRTIRLWSASTGQAVERPLLTGHTDSINSVAFSSDSNRLASGSDDNTLRLWDVTSRSPIGEALKGHSEAIKNVVFSTDGRRVITTSSDKTVRIWPVTTSWAESLCTKLPRNMSTAEWRQWVAPDIDYIKQCPNLPVPTI